MFKQLLHLQHGLEDIPFKQLIDLANNLANEVFPIPWLPIKIYA